MNFYHKQGYRFFCLASTLLLLLSIIPIRIAIAKTCAPFPQAILTLGGGSEREELAARLAQMYPSLEIWVSSGTSPESAHQTFQSAGIANTRVHLDRRAVDTVTNFTSLVKDFKKRHFQHLYVITSDFHMPRAKAVAIFVLGSQGITFTPLSVPSNKPPESWLLILRDSSRALFWIFTGYTGASLKLMLQKYAFRLLHPRHLYAWRSPMETDTLVLSRTPVS